MKKYKKIKDNKSSGKTVKVRIKNKAITSEISTKKRMRNILFVSFLVFTILIGRIGFIQIVQGGELSSMAYVNAPFVTSILDAFSSAPTGSNSILTSISASINDTAFFMLIPFLKKA